MPFYEYQCGSCGHTLEAMQKVNDAPLKKCPDCGKARLTRLMSAPVFRLKGGGWYETDFKGDQDKKKNLADRPEAEPAKDDKKAPDDAKTADAKGTDANGKEAAKPADKAADKPAPKADTPAATKRSGNGISKRGGAGIPARAAAGRPAAKKAVKKAAAKSKRR